MEPAPRAGSVFPATVEKLIDGGAGLARHEGRVAFVSGVCPGESVLLRVRTVRKGYLEADLQQVLAPSPDRVAPPCPVFGRCGGCQWQHLSYPGQIRAKTGILREDLLRIGKIEAPEILPMREAPHPLGYRTRIQLKIRLTEPEPAIGFHAAGSHRLVEIGTCGIAAPLLNKGLAALQGILRDPSGRTDSLTDVHLHLAGGTGELQARYFAEDEAPDRIERLFDRFERAVPEAVGQIFYNRTGARRVRGRDYLNERYGDTAFRVSDRSFAQVNHPQTLAMIETVLTFAAPTARESVLELFCGIGTFGVFLARGAADLTGYDENAVAVEDANHNARRLGAARGRFIAKPVEQAVADLAGDGKTFGIIVMDPPREGVGPDVLRTLPRLNASRIVYISCDAATLARDLKVLIEGGYRPGRIQPIDLFPQTHHLETVAELIRV